MFRDVPLIKPIYRLSAFILAYQIISNLQTNNFLNVTSSFYHLPVSKSLSTVLLILLPMLSPVNH